jgi:hypothetical protein
MTLQVAEMPRIFQYLDQPVLGIAAALPEERSVTLEFLRFASPGIPRQLVSPLAPMS